MSKFYSTHRFGPISTGLRTWREDGKAAWTHGYGRIVEMTLVCEALDDRDRVIDTGAIANIDEWLHNQWDHRILLAHDDPLIDQFRTLHELGGININVMPKKYGPGTEGSCRFVFDEMIRYIQNRSWKRVGIQQVRIWEHENNSATCSAFPDK